MAEHTQVEPRSREAVTPQIEREIARRVAEATAGPWLTDENPIADDDEGGADAPMVYVKTPDIPPDAVTVLFEADWGTLEDAVFVAHARQDIPYLLDRVASLLEERERLVAELKLLDPQWPGTPDSVEGCFVSYRHVLDEMARVFWKGKPQDYGCDPLELLGKYVDERDESAEADRERLMREKQHTEEQAQAAYRVFKDDVQKAEQRAEALATAIREWAEAKDSFDALNIDMGGGRDWDARLDDVVKVEAKLRALLTEQD